MKCTKVCLVRLSSNRSPLSTVENNSYYYGSILHILQIIKAHKQINLSVYVLFLLLKHLFQRLSNIYATNPSFMSGLSMKGDREASSLPFIERKGVRNYEAIYFPNHYRESV